MTKGFHSLALVLCGILLGGLMMWKFPVLAQSPSGQNATMDIAVLSAEVTKLKASAPNQSHVMGDVSSTYSPTSGFCCPRRKTGRLQTTISEKPRDDFAG